MELSEISRIQGSFERVEGRHVEECAGGRSKDTRMKTEETNSSPQGKEKVDSKSQESNPQDALKAVAEQINQYLQANNKSLHISVHEATGRFAVEVVNKTTGEVIREIPPHEVLELAARIRQAVKEMRDIGGIIDQQI